MNKSMKFTNRDKSLFSSTLKLRVDQYFADNNKSKYANGMMIFKTAFFLTIGIFLYTSILFLPIPGYLMLLFAMLLGMTMSFIGFNICHDALHGSYSPNKKVNKSLGFIFNIIGANAYVWNLTHNIVHHSYTNVIDHDEDIEIAPGLIRVHDTDKHYKIQRFQHIYAFFLYGLTTLSWFFRKDYLKFFQKQIGDSHVNKHPKIEYFNLFFYKAIYYFLFIVLPLLVMDVSWQQFLLGYILMNVAEGLVLGLVFQLAHVVEDTEFKHVENNCITDAWAVHQLKTTANFAPKSRIANFLCGGLNLQVEHHLFPKICHVHYSKLSSIVRTTAKEFDLPYYENKTFFVALRSHYFHLKKLGRPSAAVVAINPIVQKQLLKAER